MTTTGIEVVVADGYATLDFVDKARRGPALTKLIESGGPDIVQKISRVGPRTLYRVPEGNAREAGLLDDSTAVAAHPAGDSGFAAATAAAFTAVGQQQDQPQPQQQQQQDRDPDGTPSERWSRAQLDAHAASKGIATTGLPNKDAVLAALDSPIT